MELACTTETARRKHERLGPRRRRHRGAAVILPRLLRRHVLVVAGWNLARAIQKAGELFPSFRIAQDKAEALRLLRHLYEHWDEQRPAFQDPAVPKERSAKRFVELFPQGRPWSITYAKDDWLLGGVVGIEAITDALVAIEEEALQIERQLLEK